MSTQSSRWLVAIGVIVLLLILVSVVVALINPGAEARKFPQDTPEGTVQRYIQALLDRDPALARTYYTARLQEACTVSHLRNQSQWLLREGRSERIELLDTQVLPDGETHVRVRITDVRVSPPFDVDESSHDQWYILIEEGGAWRLDSPGWPISWCPGLEGEDRRS